jgi:uncharacterized metal-binding protein
VDASKRVAQRSVELHEQNNLQMTKARQLLEEWIEAEKKIDTQRVEIITMLQKKIGEIQQQRIVARQTIANSTRLLAQFESKQDDQG